MAGSRDVMAPEIYVAGVGVEGGDVESAESTKIIITITLNSEMLFAKYTHGACLQIVDIQILVPSLSCPDDFWIWERMFNIMI